MKNHWIDRIKEEDLDVLKAIYHAVVDMTSEEDDFWTVKFKLVKATHSYLNDDAKFTNFVDSDAGQDMLEHYAALGDLRSYKRYIERNYI